MSELQATARTILVLRAVEQVLKAAIADAKGAAGESMRLVGADRVRVVADDGADLGTVTMAAGRRTVQVVDEAAFTRWVQKTYPDEVVPTVRRAFRERLFADALGRTEPGEDIVVGPDGEVIPGLVLATGEPYPACRLTADAKQRMRDVLAGGRLLALTSGLDDTGQADGA